MEDLISVILYGGAVLLVAIVAIGKVLEARLDEIIKRLDKIIDGERD
jgi:hypothetical protein